MVFLGWTRPSWGIVDEGVGKSEWVGCCYGGAVSEW